MVDVIDTWASDSPDSVTLGEVTNARGKPLDLRRLIQQRWGWPKKAATRAAAFLEGEGFVQGSWFPVRGAECNDMQLELMDEIEGLLDDLLEGIGNRGSREAHDFDRPMGSITVVFTRGAAPMSYSIADEGLTNAVLGVVAQRLGVSTDELRARSNFGTVQSGPRIQVDVKGIE